MNKNLEKRDWKSFLIILGIIVLLLGVGVLKRSEMRPLPKPRITSGIRGEQFGIDKNINEATIDKYLDRKDTVYRDMRMLKDPGNYEAIGGDSYLSGFVKGFEVTPLPLIVNVSGLPEEVGNTYIGDTLYTLNADGTYTANYQESLAYLEYYFPKNKNIILMCGGGGYSGMMKDMLIKLGWNQNKIYNAGAHWSYEGNNNIAVKREVDGQISHDFWKVTYHNIDFSALNRI